MGRPSPGPMPSDWQGGSEKGPRLATWLGEWLLGVSGRPLRSVAKLSQQDQARKHKSLQGKRDKSLSHV